MWMAEILCFLIVPVVTQLYVMVYSNCVFKHCGTSECPQGARGWAKLQPRQFLVSGPWSLAQGSTAPVCLVPSGLQTTDTHSTGHKKCLPTAEEIFQNIE